MRTFAGSLRSAFMETPERTAITLLHSDRLDETLSYRALILRSAGYAAALRSLQVEPGDTVILIFDHGVDLVASFIGAVLHGAVPSIMPFLTEKLSPERYRASLSALFEITQPGALVTYPEFRGEAEKALAESYSNGRQTPEILTSSMVAENANLDWSALSGLERSPDDLVLLQHSSGTTGLQKGVALSHRAVFNQIDSYSTSMGLSSEDVVVSWLPLYHDMGLIAGFILPLLARVPLVLLSPFDWVRAPYRLMQAVSSYKGTLTWLPNFAYNFCAQKIRHRDLQGVDLSSWRAVINCSEPMHWESHEMFLQAFEPFGLDARALATCYAMAENVFAVTQGGINAPVIEDLVDMSAMLNDQLAVPAVRAGNESNALRMLSAGTPISNTRLRILDSNLSDLPERRVGEVALQSDCMLTGDYQRPDLTAKAFHDGWYLTGDLGYLADGELYITGRKKDLIIVGGKNIYPQDIERLAGEVEGIHPGRVAAFGVYNDRTGTEDVVVVAEVDPDTAGEVELIEREIRRRVTRGSDVTLREIQLVERNWLIKTSSGKVARAANREKFLQGAITQRNPR
jgi:acyl-CoA synthetase (AMP-forming)/AMP-acid ligase II